METRINNAHQISSKTQWFKSYIDTVYNVQLKRIALGYSQEELSFLLGKDKKYIYLIEAFTPNKEYYTTDIFRLAEIFDCEPKDIVGISTKPDAKVEIGVYQNFEDKRLKCYEYYLFEAGGSKLLYAVTEKPLTTKLSPSLRTILTKLVMDLMLTIPASEGSEPMYIYLYCVQKIKAFVRPTHLQNVLLSFTRNDSTGKLKKVKEDGRAIYLLVVT